MQNISFRIPYHVQADEFRTGKRQWHSSSMMRASMEKASSYQQKMLDAVVLALGCSMEQAEVCMRHNTRIICTPAQFGMLMAHRLCATEPLQPISGKAMDIRFEREREDVFDVTGQCDGRCSSNVNHKGCSAFGCRVQ